MRYLTMIVFCALTLGCSTVHTVSKANEGVVMKGSYCNHINHTFSGVQYNWCKLHGTPKEQTNTLRPEAEFEYVGIDTVFSLIADLVILPYTVYKQASSDPIDIWSSEQR